MCKDCEVNYNNKKFYDELSRQLDENQTLHNKMKKAICDEHLKSTPYSD